MENKARIVDINKNYKTGKARVTFEGDFNLAACEELMLADNDLRVDVNKWSESKPRSLSSNAYFWKLTGQLSKKLGIDAEELYREMVATSVGDNFEYGVFMNKTFDQDVEDWESRGIGWTIKPVESLTVEYQHKGDTYQATGKMVLKYYGSSRFSQDQMGRLINECIARCKEQGIQTDTPEELARLKASWGWVDG